MGHIALACRNAVTSCWRAARLRSRCAGCGGSWGAAVPLACEAAVLPPLTCRRGPTSAHLPCRRATAGELPPNLPLGTWRRAYRRAYRRSPAVPPRTYCRSPAGPRGLFCEAYGAGFADYGYLYLARVNHFVLNLLCYICRELLGLFV